MPSSPNSQDNRPLYALGGTALGVVALGLVCARCPEEAPEASAQAERSVKKTAPLSTPFDVPSEVGNEAEEVFRRIFGGLTPEPWSTDTEKLVDQLTPENLSEANPSGILNQCMQEKDGVCGGSIMQGKSSCLDPENDSGMPIYIYDRNLYNFESGKSGDYEIIVSERELNQFEVETEGQAYEYSLDDRETFVTAIALACDSADARSKDDLRENPPQICDLDPDSCERLTGYYIEESIVLDNTAFGNEEAQIPFEGFDDYQMINSESFRVDDVTLSGIERFGGPIDIDHDGIEDDADYYWQVYNSDGGFIGYAGDPDQLCYVHGICE